MYISTSEESKTLDQSLSIYVIVYNRCDYLLENHDLVAEEASTPQQSRRRL